MKWIDRIRRAATEANAVVDERHTGQSGRMLVATVDAKPGCCWGDRHCVSASSFPGKGSAKSVADFVCVELAELGKAEPCDDPDCDFCEDGGLTWNGCQWVEA